VFWIGNTLLTLDKGFEAAGFFAVAYVIFQSFILIPNSIVIPMIPKVSELMARSRDTVDNLVSKTVRTISIVLFPLAFGLALFAHYVVGLLYGSEFSSSDEAVYLMICASYFYALSALVGGLIAGAGRMWLGLAINLCWGAVFLVVALLFIPAWDVPGLGLAFAGSYAVLLVVSFFTSKHSLSVDLKTSYLSAASSAVFFVIGFIVCIEFGMSEVLVKAALFGASLAYFYIIGREAFAEVIRRARGFLGSPRS
jgi:O-antigen/teichoic acid export membrane protein